MACIANKSGAKISYIILKEDSRNWTSEIGRWRSEICLNVEKGEFKPRQPP